LWTIFEIAGAPTAFVTDQKYSAKMADISEKLEKAGGPHAGHSQELEKGDRNRKNLSTKAAKRRLL
jgi:hypothetical protein